MDEETVCAIEAVTTRSAWELEKKLRHTLVELVAPQLRIITI